MTSKTSTPEFTMQLRSRSRSVGSLRSAPTKSSPQKTRKTESVETKNQSMPISSASERSPTNLVRGRKSESGTKKASTSSSKVHTKLKRKSRSRSRHDLSTRHTPKTPSKLVFVFDRGDKSSHGRRNEEKKVTEPMPISTDRNFEQIPFKRHQFGAVHSNRTPQYHISPERKSNPNPLTVHISSTPLLTMARPRVQNFEDIGATSNTPMPPQKKVLTNDLAMLNKRSEVSRELKTHLRRFGFFYILLVLLCFALFSIYSVGYNVRGAIEDLHARMAEYISRTEGRKDS